VTVVSEGKVTKSKPFARSLQIGVAVACIAALWSLWTDGAGLALRFRVFWSVWLLALPVYMWWINRSVERLREKLERNQNADRES